MVAVVDRSAFPIPLPRTRVDAVVLSPSAARRTAIVGRLRAIGAVALVRAVDPGDGFGELADPGQHDVCLIDATHPDTSAQALVQEAQRRGWTRLVLLSSRDDPYAVRAAMSQGVRGYVRVPAEDEALVLPSPVRGRTRGGSPDELSDREVEVLQKVADGLSNHAVGEELGLSGLTVKSHLARISRKLGTGDRAELVAIAMRAGLLH
ncbi:MAG: response regulator transcription factor [Candidatus Nanopelagicales bacterium]